MPLTLGKVNRSIVDLRRSVIDKEKSDLKKNNLVFTKKVYISEKDYLDATIRPEYHFEWAAKDREGRSIQDYLYMDYEFVTPRDRYWPEGARLSEEDHFEFKDAVLMKVPFMKWITRRAEEIEKSEKASKRTRESFRAGLARDEGANAVLSEEEITKLIG